MRMTPPMVGAMVAMMAFNLVDTWFVARLGTDALAAMGFTFPIVMLFHSVSMGLGLGTSACVSRAIGTGNRAHSRTLATYSLLLGFLVSFTLCLSTWAFLPRIFTGMGASGSTLHLTLQYMHIWLLFGPFTVLPMIGNNAIRATGDTLRPSIIMITAALLNTILDPILIFGIGPIPSMGITGAALATGISRLLTVWWALWLMHGHDRLFSPIWVGWQSVLATWREVLKVAIPSAATNALMPLTAGVITRMIATYGEQAVAATAAGQRIERITYVIPMAMATVLVPIIGQNWGAGRIDRVRAAWVSTNWYSATYGIIMTGIMFLAGQFPASLFSKEPRVVTLTTHYLLFMLSASALMHSATHAGFALNAIHKPLHAATLTIIRLAVLVLPLAWFGSHLYGVHGIFAGIAAAHLLCGGFALVLFPLILARHQRSTTNDESDRKKEALAGV